MGDVCWSEGITMRGGGLLIIGPNSKLRPDLVNIV